MKWKVWDGVRDPPSGCRSALGDTSELKEVTTGSIATKLQDSGRAVGRRLSGDTRRGREDERSCLAMVL